MNADPTSQSTPPSSPLVPVEITSPAELNSQHEPSSARSSNGRAQADFETPESRSSVVVPSDDAASRRPGRRLWKRISNLAPGITSKLNLAADCGLVILASAVST